MTKFVVLLNAGGNQATIALEGYTPTDGSVEVGSFEMNVDPINARVLDTSEMAGSQHEHPYIQKAKQVLADSDDFRGEVNSLTFLDKASNAAVHPEDTLSTDDNIDALESGTANEEERQDGGETPAGGEGADHSESGSGTDGQNGQDGQEDEHDGETIDQLKERLKGETDKEALEVDYKAEQEGKNRAGAIAAYEARAQELAEADQTA